MVIEIAHTLPAKNMSTSLRDKKELADIRKESLDIYNRIHSVAEDALFVENIAEHSGEYPVIRTACFLPLSWARFEQIPTANLRCGAWYVRPDLVCSHLHHQG